MKSKTILLVGLLVFALPLHSYGETTKKKSKAEETIEQLEKQQATNQSNLQRAERGTIRADGLQETASGRLVERSRVKAKQKEQPNDDYLKTIQRKSSESDKKKLK